MHSSALKQNVECLRVCCSAYCAGEEMNANPLSCTVNHQPTWYNTNQCLQKID